MKTQFRIKRKKGKFIVQELIPEHWETVYYEGGNGMERWDEDYEFKSKKKAKEFIKFELEESEP